MGSIFEGIVKKGGNDEVPYSVRKLTTDDLREILDVQGEVVLQLKDKGVLQPLSRDEFQFILAGNGLMIGAFAAGKLIAFRALLVPPLDEEHLGWDLGLAEIELPMVIYQEISNVLPEYRGNGLQKILAALIMEELGRQSNNFRYICCTVAPFNIPSLKDKFAQGMQIGALKEKYGGQLRYIFVKELVGGDGVITASWREITTIPMADIEAQKEKLSQGWRGFQMEANQDGILVYYGRK